MGVHPYIVKEKFDLEEYSLSQSTLEQVGHFQWLHIILKMLIAEEMDHWIKHFLNKFEGHSLKP